MASDTSFANLLECPICYEQFKTAPKQLPCKHTLCEACLHGLVQFNSIICPECREESLVPTGGVADFPNDLTMQRFLEHHRTQALQMHTGPQQQKLQNSVKKPFEDLAPHQQQDSLLDLQRGLQDAIHRIERDKEVFTKANQSLQEERQRYQQWKLAAQKRITEGLDHVEGIVKQRKLQLLNDIETLYQKALLGIETEEVKVEVKKQGMEKLSQALAEKLTLSATVGSRNDQKQVKTMISQVQAVDANLQKGIVLQLTQLNLLETGMDTLLSGIQRWGHVAATAQIQKIHPPEAPTVDSRSQLNLPRSPVPNQNTPVILPLDMPQTSKAVAQQPETPSLHQQSMPVSPRSKKPPSQQTHIPPQVQVVSQLHVVPPVQGTQTQVSSNSQVTPFKMPNPSHIEQQKQQQPSNRYTSMGKMSLQFGYEGGPGLLSSPLAVAELPNGTLAVTNGMTYEIKIFDNQGHHVKSISLPARGSFKHGITGLAVHPAGHICASNPDRKEVQLLSPEGQVKGHLRAKVGIGEEKFCPWGLVCSSHGIFYICDRANHKVRVFSASGAYTSSFGGRGKGPGKFDCPMGIALLCNDCVAVADFNNHRIQIFTPAGAFIQSFGAEGSGLGELKGPADISTDCNGYIAVTEMTNNRVQIFTPDGQPVVTFGQTGSENGQFVSPRGVVISMAGHVIVCDTKNDRVQIFH